MVEATGIVPPASDCKTSVDYQLQMEVYAKQERNTTIQACNHLLVPFKVSFRLMLKEHETYTTCPLMLDQHRAVG